MKKKHGLVSKELKKKLRTSRNDYEILEHLAAASNELDDDDLFLVTGGDGYHSSQSYKEIDQEALSLMTGGTGVNDNSQSQSPGQNQDVPGTLENLFGPGTNVVNTDITNIPPGDVNDYSSGASMNNISSDMDVQPNTSGTPSDQYNFNGAIPSYNGDPWSLINIDTSGDQAIEQSTTTVDVMKKNDLNFTF